MSDELPTILGLGTASPSYSIGQRKSVEVARQFVAGDHPSLASLPTLYRMTTVQHRGSVLLEAPADEVVQQSFYPVAIDDQQRGPTTRERMQQYALHASALATHAAREALDAAAISADQIAHLVIVTCTGFQSPGIDIDVIEQLCLPRGTQRTQVGFMGCHGLINGLRVARGLHRVDRKGVLVVAVELCSLHYRYGWDNDRVVANALFADGAAAALVGDRLHNASNATTQTPLKIVDTASWLVPNTRDYMTWQIGDHGFEMTLSQHVPTSIEAGLRAVLEPWLQRHDVSIDQVAQWAIHPGGPRVVQASERALGLAIGTAADSRAILQQHGNMSSATLGFILKRISGRQTHGPIVMLGFGPGLEIEAALLHA
jgi:predicted naringenin-chalcone synthase